ncbi:hypothetical protein HY485_04095 [Candidatus Woesearchaeota archaeon]|nr:hypothetical protein [Candidatus Woesearchaeota archaeon]
MGLINRLLVKIFEPNVASRLEELLNNAREASKTGNVDYVESRLLVAQNYAKLYELLLSEREVKYIQEIAHIIDLANTISYAKKYADKGSVPVTITAVEHVKKLLLKRGEGINTIWAAEVIDLAYRNGIDKYFEAAEQYMKKGWCGDTWERIYRARICAQKVGVDIKEREREFFNKYPDATHPDMIPFALQEMKNDVEKAMTDGLRILPDLSFDVFCD